MIVDTQLIQSTEIAKMDGTEKTAVVNNHDVKTTRGYEVTFPFRVPLSTAVAPLLVAGGSGARALLAAG